MNNIVEAINNTRLGFDQDNWFWDFDVDKFIDSMILPDGSGVNRGNRYISLKVMFWDDVFIESFPKQIQVGGSGGIDVPSILCPSYDGAVETLDLVLDDRRNENLFDLILNLSNLWFVNRNRTLNISGVGWLQNPLLYV